MRKSQAQTALSLVHQNCVFFHSTETCFARSGNRWHDLVTVDDQQEAKWRPMAKQDHAQLVYSVHSVFQGTRVDMNSFSKAWAQCLYHTDDATTWPKRTTACSFNRGRPLPLTHLTSWCNVWSPRWNFRSLWWKLWSPWSLWPRPTERNQIKSYDLWVGQRKREKRKQWQEASFIISLSKSRKKQTCLGGGVWGMT